MWLMRDPGPVEDTVLAALRACPSSQLVSLVLSASTSRGRPSILALLRAEAGAQHCRIALAETRGVVVRWVDGIVTGTVEDVLAFLVASGPVLDRCHGRAELAAA
jgi:phosphoglycerate dehydrogenase-like enzyme